MGVKVYISGISGNKEVKKRQQRVCMILESRNIEYSVVDITDPGRESEKDYMQEKSTSLGATVSDTNPRHPLPPQLFNDEEYCGDYDQFDLANEIDELDKFLKLAPGDRKVSNAEIIFGNANGTAKQEKESEVESVEPVADLGLDVTDIIKELQEVEESVTSEQEVDSSDIPAEEKENENENDENAAEDDDEA